MALLTHQWQQPDVDSLVRLALMGREQDRQAAVQQLEHQQAVQKNAQDLALQLAQQRRIEDQQQFKNSLDVATLMQHGALANARAARLAALSNKPGIAPLTLPDDGSPALPGGDGTVSPPVPGDQSDPLSAAPAMDPAASMLLNSSGTPTDAQALSLSSPSPFSLQLAGQSPSIDPVSAGIMQSQANPIPDPGQPIISPDVGQDTDSQTYQDQTADATPSAFQPTDFAGMMRDTAATGADFPQADGPPDTQQTWANLRAQGGLPANPTVPGNAAGPGLSGEPDLFGGQQVPGGPGTVSGGINPAGSIRSASADPVSAAFNQLPDDAKTRVRAQNAMVKAGQAKPGSDVALMQQELVRAAKPTKTQAGPRLQMKVAQDGTAYAFNPATGETHAVDGLPDGVAFGAPGRAGAAAKGTMDDQITKDGFHRVAPETVNGAVNVVANKDGTALLKATQSANGNVVFKDFKSGDDLEHAGSTLIKRNPDGSRQIVVDMRGIPSTIQKEYFDAVQDASTKKDAMDAATAGRKGNPWSMGNMGGITQGQVDDATAAHAAALAKVNSMVDAEPRLDPKNRIMQPVPKGVVEPPVPTPMATPSAAPAPQAAPATDSALRLQQARDALNRGVSRVAVTQKLRELGIDPSGL